MSSKVMLVCAASELGCRSIQFRELASFELTLRKCKLEKWISRKEFPEDPGFRKMAPPSWSLGLPEKLESEMLTPS